jgi:hypothetical protein
VKHLKFYLGVEFVKEYFLAVAGILCPDNSNDMHAISLSRHIVIRHIKELAADLEHSLGNELQNLRHFP